MPTSSEFNDFLIAWKAYAEIGAEDVLACFLPLLKETLAAHGRSQVAPLMGTGDLRVDNQRLWFEEHRCQSARYAAWRLSTVEAKRRSSWNIVSESQRDLDVDTGLQTVTELHIAEAGDPSEFAGNTTGVAYFRGYLTWEHTLEHHDPLTDIFSLGMILASLALQLDFHDPDELQQFVKHRNNLFQLNRNLHPVLAQTICQMTELYRDDRSQDLHAVLHVLENYRDQVVSIDIQLALDKLQAASQSLSPTERVLPRLRDRLFDLSRRNPLLSFRSTAQALNLTQASMPLSINVQNIRADKLFIWDQQIQTLLSKGQAIRLNQRINFNEAVYVSSVLERLIADARRDRNEYGCSQLRLVIAFLGWANLKEKPIQNYLSPLILLPVNVVKQKGIRDTFSVEPLDSQAEVNPVIRHMFKQLYNIFLPETVDIENGGVDQLYELLNTQILANEPAVSLNKIERPRIELIHEKAKRRLDQYRRASRVSGRGASRFDDIDYSYDAINYHPLGVRLFTQRVRQPSFHLQRLMTHGVPKRNYAIPTNNTDSDNTNSVAQASAEKDAETLTVERDIAVVQDASSDNPYQWSFDLCNVTLVNLHYRRMSLVRDYETIIQQRITNTAFDSAFSDKPKEATEEPLCPIALPDRFEVVVSDPTQSRAISQARSGRSYIIQGPPGTGKSQTITNLIADFVAQGKRVLFVCEKRAAIDVVYARLKQSGLGPLCSLVHDSQTDKKEFIQDLQQTYQAFTANDAKQSKTTTAARQRTIDRMHLSLQSLSAYESAMESTLQSPDGSIKLTMRQLLDRIVARRAAEHTASGPLDVSNQSNTRSQPPSLPQWWEHHTKLQQLRVRLENLNASKIYSAHPLRALRSKAAKHDQAIVQTKKLCQRTLEQLEQLESVVAQSGIAAEHWSTFECFEQLLDFLKRLSPLANDANLQLLDARSARTLYFRKALTQIGEKQAELEAANARTVHWKNKLTAEESWIALPQAQGLQANALRWLTPAYWRLRKLLNTRYDFSKHAVRPTWTQVLEDLQAAHTAQEQLNKVTQSVTKELELQASPSEVETLIRQLTDDLPKLPAWIGSIHRELMTSPQANATIAKSRAVLPYLNALRETTAELLVGWAEFTANALRSELQGIRDHAHQIPSVADLLELIDSLPTSISHYVRSQPTTYDRMEAHVEEHAWSSWLQARPEIERFNAAEQSTHIVEIEDQIDRWLSYNAQEICQRTCERFLLRMQPDLKNAAFSKRYQQGRKLLEHEFGKTMRYRPIRDLVDGDSGMVVLDLKPIWLMSPLSVSDTLPLNTQFVDVVIFDEASQVRLEDAIPTLFRGVQTIIVGDTMQLPPTNFFAQKNPEANLEGELETSDEATENVATDLDLTADSLLSHAGKSMESTMLGWHYRSRSESLISFSNWAFYDGRLLTVPDCRRHLSSPETSVALQSEEASSDAVRETSIGYMSKQTKSRAIESPETSSEPAETSDWLKKPIVFEFLADGVYDQRRNRREADKIAEMVAACLADGTGRTLGVIAFSEAQQTEIEQALEERARNDQDFAVRYEQELNREEHGQFVGLLVKNLENIQGDERDVIFLSVCYGPNPLGKISMNFGPINRDGGEKRLNVAFSRAKRHMVVISSMRSGQITNDYNLGPSCLKQYLKYVEAMSCQDVQGAQLALQQLSRLRGREQETPLELDPVTESISKALLARGFLLDNQVGQSHFRINIALYAQDEPNYRLGILVDTPTAYRQSDPWERDVMRPRLLRDFGWRTLQVLGKDWWSDPEGELARIIEAFELGIPKTFSNR